MIVTAMFVTAMKVTAMFATATKVSTMFVTAVTLNAMIVTAKIASAMIVAAMKVKSRKRASFSHIQSSVFEDVSHESFVFTSSHFSF